MSDARGKQKYDWAALQREFIEGPWREVTEFLRHKAIPRHRHIAVKTKGWAEEKKRTEQQAYEEAKKRLVHRRAEIITTMDEHILDIAQALLPFLKLYLAKVTTMTADEIRMIQPEQLRAILTPSEIKTIWEMIMVRLGLPTSISKSENIEERRELTSEEFAEIDADRHKADAAAKAAREVRGAEK